MLDKRFDLDMRFLPFFIAVKRLSVSVFLCVCVCHVKPFETIMVIKGYTNKMEFKRDKTREGFPF